MSWRCPMCKSNHTRELWDNTGYGGDIKCNDCNHTWDAQVKQHGGPGRGQGRHKEPGYTKLVKLRFESKEEEEKVKKLTPRERVKKLLK